MYPYSFSGFNSRDCPKSQDASTATVTNSSKAEFSSSISLSWYQLQMPITNLPGPLYQLTSVGAVGPAADSIPAWLHPDPGYGPGAPPPPEADRGYPPQYAVYGLSPSCLRRTPEAPFFRSLHALAVDNGPAGTGMSPLTLPYLGNQGVVNPRPGPIPSPDPEVVIDQLPRRQVVWQQTPSTTGAQHVPDAIHHLSAGIFSRTTAQPDRWDQRLQNPPLGISRIRGISCPAHEPSLWPMPPPCLAISGHFLNTF